MGVHSGKFGTVNGVSNVRNWTIEDEQELTKYVSSATGLGAGRNAGVESWSGGYSQYDAEPAAMPGDTISFIGYTAPTTDVAGTNGVRYTGTAVIDQVEIVWDWTTNAKIVSNTTFIGHLALVVADGVAVVDAGAVTAASTSGGKIEYGVDIAVAQTEWTNVTGITLTITAENVTYVNSSTVIAGVVWQGVKAGTIDFTLTVTEEDDDRTKLIKGALTELRLYINATEYYQLIQARVKSFTGLSVDEESGAILSQTVNLEMAAADAAGVVGTIKLPDLSTWWP